jgi:hypothetical protein
MTPTSSAGAPFLNERFASAFRALETQYQVDLDAFRAFNQSHAIAAVRKANLAVNNKLPDVVEYQQLFTLSFLETQKRSSEWHAAYAGQADSSKGSGT